jgi:hypothetical protein
MGILDKRHNDDTAHTFTITLADGSTWTPPADQRYNYSIDAGVLTIHPINAAGEQLPGARHYSPTGWTDLIEHDRSTITAVHEQVAGLRS